MMYGQFVIGQVQICNPKQQVEGLDVSLLREHSLGRSLKETGGQPIIVYLEEVQTQSEFDETKGLLGA